MANRVAGADVKEIINTTLTASEVEPFITPANLTVTSVTSGAGYSDALLTEIEKWLSAHFVAVRDPRAASEKIGDASVKYRGKTDMGLDASIYGQQVKILDTDGLFSDVGKRAASIETIDPTGAEE